MRWAAFVTLLFCSAGGVVLVMIWLAHNGAHQKHTLDRRLVLGHSLAGIVGLCVFAAGIIRGDGSLLRLATQVTAAAFIAGALLVAGWLMRRQEAYAAAEREDALQVWGRAEASDATAIGGADVGSDALFASADLTAPHLVYSGEPELRSAAASATELEELVELVSGNDLALAGYPTLVVGGGSVAGTTPTDGSNGRQASPDGGPHLHLVTGDVPGADVARLAVTRPWEAAAPDDLSFAAAAFDWQAIGVYDDGTSADDHLPLAIIIAHGVAAFAALVLMFAAAG